MLTLQQLLESDSIATLVAKLNTNFQELSLSNGGPQGSRGTQGIPGLPGKRGASGPSGATGATGTITGIIPFVNTSALGIAGVGPTIPAPNGQSVVWPASSWNWLTEYATPGTGSYTGAAPQHGSLYVDHAHEGFWMWMTGPVTSGTGGLYYYNSATAGASYPNLGATGGWCGNGWYFYPEPAASASLSTVWVADNTTYLLGATGAVPGATGPYAYGPALANVNSLLTVPNARMVSKYGTVWITSGSNSTDSGGDDALATPTIGEWGLNPNTTTPPAARPGKSNAGVDRLLFKMSMDSLPYLSNITARGFSGASGLAYIASATYPAGTGIGNPMVGDPFWVKPAYGISMEQYTPLLFLSERNEGSYGDAFSSAGMYMHTANDTPIGATGEGYHKSLFLWSSRAAEDPIEMLAAGVTGGSPINSASTVNYGELALDFRRLIASNQYVCSVPADMRLSQEDVVSAGYTGGGTGGNRVYGGYISAINGKVLTGDATMGDYWEYGLGTFTPADYVAAGGDGGTHDPASGTAGMYTRNNWYGSAVLGAEPSDWESTTPGTNDYVRVAGMMERGRRYATPAGTPHNNYFSELIFYTSQFRINDSTPGFTGAYGVDNSFIDPLDNEHQSLPSLYISPFRNVGIGTFVGGTAAVGDQGPIEPRAHLHVHTKYTDSGDNDPTSIYEQLNPSGSFEAPMHTFKSGVFSGEAVTGTASSTLIFLANLTTPLIEPINPGGDTVTRFLPATSLNSAIRADAWADENLASLRLGTKGYTAATDIGSNSNAYSRGEFQLHLHPLNKFSGGVPPLNENVAVVGVGLHNNFPQTRVHLYGKNMYNEGASGAQGFTPGAAATGPSGSFPFYPPAATPYPSNNQIVIDYLADSYRYTAGIRDYQYGGIGGSTGSTAAVVTAAYNSAVYPYRESQSPTRHYIPYSFDDVNYAYPSATGAFNGAYKHGGTGNGMFPLSSYIGFNLFRDISSADGHTGGDNADQTRWHIGTTGSAGLGGADNGAAAIVFSPNGELGIVTIPKGRDGGRAYQQWEQNGLGTRDVLNNIKVLFDANGNIGVGNAPGWDYDAYPSLDRNTTTGKLNYVPTSGATTNGPTASTGGSPFTIAYWGTSGQYGNVSYTSAGAETSALSSAALANRRATTSDYIRLEVAAEKGWSSNGRMAERGGWGYPANLVDEAVLNPGNYLRGGANVSSITAWGISTDAEGRIISSTITYVAVAAATTNDFTTIIYPHPSEFNAGGPQATLPPYVAPAGAQAAEWAGLSQEYLDGTYTGSLGTAFGGPGAGATFEPRVTLVPRGGANIRLNNYVAGEGSESYPGEDTIARQTSPRLILSFLEKTPTASRANTGLVPYRKVNTVLLSAQNESSLREYYIPRADNTGGTLMTFTDHLGSKEYVDGFDRQLTSGTGYNAGGTGATGNISKLLLTQVVTCEILRGSTGGGNSTMVTGTATNVLGLVAGNPFTSGGSGGTGATGLNQTTKSIGYVNYFNTLPSGTADGTTGYFLSTEFGERTNVVGPVFTSGLDIVGPGAGVGNPGGYSGITGAELYTNAAVRRNIDHYYDVYQGSTASYGGLMDADGWDSQATEIRFKRINSEYALVDFNITVEVKNTPVDPVWNDGGGSRAIKFIDFAVPRMTQSLTFIYNADDDLANDGTENTWGNGPWMHMWSGYRNWLPGHAVVGDNLSALRAQTLKTPGRSGVVDNPYFNDSLNLPNPLGTNNRVRTWTGNRLSAGYFERTATEMGANGLWTIGGFSIFGDVTAGGPASVYGTRENFLVSPINRALSVGLFGDQTSDSGTFTDNKIKALSFMYHLPGYQGQWGGQTLSRTRPCSWRMLPTRYTETTVAGALTGKTNNTFKLEIMFDVPIMHSDHAFNTNGWYGNSDPADAPITPYKYLTISGQGIIRYGKTTQTTVSPTNGSYNAVPA